MGQTNNFANFTAQENLGRQIFFGRRRQSGRTCSVCHGTDNFVPTPTLNNNGLEYPYVDFGVGGSPASPPRTASSRFLVLQHRLTAPYMHDGRFTNLTQVVDFYNSGVVYNPNLSPPLLAARRQKRPPPEPDAPRSKAALVAFLNTLTDTNLVADVRLSDPFNYGN